MCFNHTGPEFPQFRIVLNGLDFLFRLGCVGNAVGTVYVFRYEVYPFFQGVDSS